MKIFWSSTIIVLLFASDLVSQVPSRSRRPVIQETNKDKSFADHLWYGGGFGISFNQGFTGFSGNTFSIGFSPMVGYKLNRIFSIGPRIEVEYTNGRFNTSGRSIAKYNGFDYGAGVFARAKLLPFIFAHSEISYINQSIPTTFSTSGDKIEAIREGNNQLLAGLGYTSGGDFRSEIYLLYDFMANDQTTTLPIVYRFGLTYRF